MGAQSLYFEYIKNDKILSRLSALIGATDPIVKLIKKNDRIGYIDKKFNLTKSKIVYEDEELIVIDFDKDEVPSLGANGFMLKNKFNNEYFKQALHIDGCYYNIKNNINPRIVFFKNLKTHHKLEVSLFKMVKRRMYYKLKFQKKRLYKMIGPKDWFQVLKMIFIIITVIYPLWYSIKLFMKSGDKSSFLYFPMVYLFFFGYFFSLFNLIKK